MNLSILKKLTSILNKKQQRKIFGLGLLILIGGLLETLGVSMVVPLVTVILDVEGMQSNQYVQMICNTLHITNMNDFIVLLVIAVILMFVIKNGYLIFLTYVQNRFVNNSQYKAGSYMLEEYLNRPYEFYLNADIPTIFRILDGDIPKVFALLMSLIRLVTEAFVAICLFVLLLVIDVKMTLLLLGLLSVMTLVIAKVLKPFMNKIGKENQEVQSLAGRWRTKAVY